jgi:short-subunit dehydrogenase
LAETPASRDRQTRGKRLNLANKRALITGAGQGLGREIAFALARAGAEVIVTDLNAAAVQESQLKLEAVGYRAHGYSLDVTQSNQIEEARKRILSDLGPIDILVNNAGLVFGGEFVSVPLDRHRKTIDVNLTGMIAVTHAFLPDLIARPEAALVNIASASAVVPLPWAASYAASKAAVVSFSESLREELRLLGKRHVLVTTICPSFISTGLFEGARPARLTWMLTPEKVAAAVVRSIERGRSFVILPWTAGLLYALGKCFPVGIYRRICALLGVSTSMRDWRGHQK